MLVAIALQYFCLVVAVTDVLWTHSLNDPTYCDMLISVLSLTVLFIHGSRPPQETASMASASRAEGPGFESRLRRDFSGSSHTSDLKIGPPVATLPGAWDW